MDYRRGDIFYVGWADGSAPVGSEQRPGRPGIIVSSDDDNAHANTVQVVYLTSQEKPPRPTHVKVVCKVLSTALCEQLHTVDKSRLGSFVRTCTDKEMEEIERGLLHALGMQDRLISPILDETRFTFTELEEYGKQEVERCTKIIAAERDVYKRVLNETLDRITKQESRR